MFPSQQHQECLPGCSWSIREGGNERKCDKWNLPARNSRVKSFNDPPEASVSFSQRLGSSLPYSTIPPIAADAVNLCEEICEAEFASWKIPLHQKQNMGFFGGGMRKKEEKLRKNSVHVNKFCDSNQGTKILWWRDVCSSPAFYCISFCQQRKRMTFKAGKECKRRDGMQHQWTNREKNWSGVFHVSHSYCSLLLDSLSLSSGRNNRRTRRREKLLFIQLYGRILSPFHETVPSCLPDGKRHSLLKSLVLLWPASNEKYGFLRWKEQEEE